MLNDKSFLDVGKLSPDSLIEPHIVNVTEHADRVELELSDKRKKDLPAVTPLPGKIVNGGTIQGETLVLTCVDGSEIYAEGAQDTFSLRNYTVNGTGLLVDPVAGKFKPLRFNTPHIKMEETENEIQVTNYRTGTLVRTPGALNFERVSLLRRRCLLSVEGYTPSLPVGVPDTTRYIPFGYSTYNQLNLEVDSTGAILLPVGHYYLDFEGSFQSDFMEDVQRIAPVYLVDADTQEVLLEPTLVGSDSSIVTALTKGDLAVSSPRRVRFIVKDVLVTSTIKAAGIYNHGNTGNVENYPYQVLIWLVSDTPLTIEQVDTKDPKIEHLYRGHSPSVTMGEIVVKDLINPVLGPHAATSLSCAATHNNRLVFFPQVLGYNQQLQPFAVEVETFTRTDIPISEQVTTFTWDRFTHVPGYSKSNAVYLVSTNSGVVTRYVPQKPGGDVRPVSKYGYDYFATQAHKAAPTGIFTVPSTSNSTATFRKMSLNLRLTGVGNEYKSNSTSAPVVNWALREPVNVTGMVLSTGTLAKVKQLQLEFTKQDTTVAQFTLTASGGILDTGLINVPLVTNIKITVLETEAKGTTLPFDFSFNGWELHVADPIDLNRPEGTIEFLTHGLATAFKGAIGNPINDEVLFYPATVWDRAKGLHFYNEVTGTWRSKSFDILSPLPGASNPVFNQAICSPVNDCIYLIGSDATAERSSYIYVYNPKYDTLTLVVANATGTHLVNLISGKIYIFRGPNQRVGFIDPRTNTYVCTSDNIYVSATSRQSALQMNTELLILPNSGAMIGIDGRTGAPITPVLAHVNQRNYIKLLNGAIVRYSEALAANAGVPTLAVVTFDNPSPPDPRTVYGPYVNI